MEILSRWFGAITLTTGLALAGAMLGFWVVWLDGDTKSLLWKVAFSAAIVCLLGAFSSVRDELKSQDDARAAQLRIDGVDEKAGNAEVEAKTAIATARDALNRPATRGGTLMPRNTNRAKAVLHKGITDEDFVVSMGGTYFATTELPLTVIRQGDEPMLSILPSENGDGIVVNATFCNDAGDVVCEIANNRFTVVEHHVFDIRRPDPHTLIVAGIDGNELLKLSYFNDKLLFVDGDFYVRDSIKVSTVGGIFAVEDFWLFGNGLIRDGGSSGHGAAIQIGPSNEVFGINVLSPTVLKKMNITPEILAKYPRAEAAVRRDQPTATE